MLITRIFSGLGNQMFQYAAGLALAERHRTVLKLDVEWFRHYPEYAGHNRYALSCFNITEQFATREEIERLRGLPLSFPERLSLRLARPLRFFQYLRRNPPAGRYHAQQQPGHYPGFDAIDDDTYIEGMWQSESFLTEIAPLLRLHFSFRYPLTPAAARTASLIRGARPSVAMHFRRGDYVSDPRFAREIGAVDTDYYRRAETLVRERFPDATLFIFSDDLDAVRAEYIPDGPHHFVEASGRWTAHEDLHLLSLCDHAIISNSTFAWWGAWLHDRESKLVVAPEPWFADGRAENEHIVPKKWIRLPRFAESLQLSSFTTLVTFGQHLEMLRI